MNNQLKQTYVPCEVRVTEFNVEREFAGGSNGNKFISSPISESDANTLVWSMTSDNGNFRNMESYKNQDFKW